jgi:hypothetical protein
MDRVRSSNGKSIYVLKKIIIIIIIIIILNVLGYGFITGGIICVEGVTWQWVFSPADADVSAAKGSEH